MGGGNGETTTQQQGGSQSTQFDPMKGEWQQELLNLFRALSPGFQSTTQNVFANLLGPLSQGQYASGIFGDLGKGLSEESIQNIINRGVSSANVGMAGQGILDSGAAASL